MSTSPHYFIAIPLSLSLQDNLSKWQQELKQKLSYKQWPHKNDLHITLKFLGPVEQEKLDELNDKLKQIRNIPSFTLEVGSVGTFGKADQPRVLWAGVNKEESLSFIQQKVENLAEKVGFQKEKRPYRPHITIAKKWNGPKATDSIEEIMQQHTIEQQQLTVGEIVIYQIFPTNTPKYEVVYRYKLNGDGRDGSTN